MTILDLRTVLLLSVFIAFLTGPWMLINCRLQKGFSGFGHLASAHFCLGAGFLLVALRDLLPAILSILLANLLLILAIILAFEGIKAFRQIEVKGRSLCLVVFVAIAGLYSCFTFVQPNLLARMLIYDVASFVLLLLCIRALLKNAEASLLLPLLATATPFALAAAITLLRFFYNSLGIIPESLLQGNLIFSLQVIAADMILVGTALGFTAIANRKLTARLEQETLTDSLTQVLNRRALEGIAGKIVGHARRHDKPASLLLIDLDHFKQVNDSFGHPAGDAALQQFARLVRQILRDSDILARYGGEEFIAVLPDTGKLEAYATAERLRDAVCKNEFSSAEKTMRFTASVGHATCPADGDEWLTLLAKADKALYQAKLAGRNRVYPLPA
jgi:diguanylate cyclase (GGDEF)-like protein